MNAWFLLKVWLGGNGLFEVLQLLRRSPIRTRAAIIDNLKKLNDLYKSGAITKDEFKKAKEKILN